MREGQEELGGVWGEEIIIRIHYIKNLFFNKMKDKSFYSLILITYRIFPQRKLITEIPFQMPLYVSIIWESNVDIVFRETFKSYLLQKSSTFHMPPEFYPNSFTFSRQFNLYQAEEILQPFLILLMKAQEFFNINKIKVCLKRTYILQQNNQQGK